MTKYYTREECFSACEDDDFPFVLGGFNCPPKYTKKSLLINPGLFNVSLEDVISDKWQIKRAEPVVMDAETFIRNYEAKLSQRQFVAKADQNGQLREWLRPEQVELREAVREYVENENVISYGRIRKALENLKPPYDR